MQEWGSVLSGALLSRLWVGERLQQCRIDWTYPQNDLRVNLVEVVVVLKPGFLVHRENQMTKGLG